MFATTSSVSWGFLFSLVFFFFFVVDLVAIFASFFVSFRTQQSNNSQEVIVLDWDALNIMDSKKYSLRPSLLWLKYHVIIIISSSLLFLHNFFLSLLSSWRLICLTFPNLPEKNSATNMRLMILPQKFSQSPATASPYSRDLGNKRDLGVAQPQGKTRLLEKNDDLKSVSISWLTNVAEGDCRWLWWLTGWRKCWYSLLPRLRTSSCFEVSSYAFE